MIWLLRHGEAEDTAPDSERKLTPKGREQARAVGQALARLGVKVEACLTSPNVRAAETARIASEELGLDVKLESRLAGGPFDAEQLAGGLEGVLLVGHDPDFSGAVRQMTGAQVRMKKGGLAGVENGELKVLLRPRELRALAGS
jgi:phosphohistidine phosphatase